MNAARRKRVSAAIAKLVEIREELDEVLAEESGLARPAPDSEDAIEWIESAIGNIESAENDLKDYGVKTP